jgi:hypothetical protein
MDSAKELRSSFFKRDKLRWNRCLAPGMGCPAAAIRAHSLQNSQVLDLLARDGHVKAIVKRIDKKIGPGGCYWSLLLLTLLLLLQFRFLNLQAGGRRFDPVHPPASAQNCCDGAGSYHKQMAQSGTVIPLWLPTLSATVLERQGKD